MLHGEHNEHKILISFDHSVNINLSEWILKEMLIYDKFTSKILHFNKIKIHVLIIIQNINMTIAYLVRN